MKTLILVALYFAATFVGVEACHPVDGHLKSGTGTVDTFMIGDETSYILHNDGMQEFYTTHVEIFSTVIKKLDSCHASYQIVIDTTIKEHDFTILWSYPQFIPTDDFTPVHWCNWEDCDEQGAVVFHSSYQKGTDGYELEQIHFYHPELTNEECEKLLFK